MARGGFIHPFQYTEEEKKQILSILDAVLLHEYNTKELKEQILISLEKNAGHLLSLVEQEQSNPSKTGIRDEVKQVQDTIASLLDLLHQLSDTAREELDLALQEKFYEFNDNPGLQKFFQSQKGYPIDTHELFESTIDSLETLDSTLGKVIREILKENLRGRNRHKSVRSYFFLMAKFYESYTGKNITRKGTFQKLFEASLKPVLKKIEKKGWELPIKPNSNKSIDEMDFSNAIENLIRGYKNHLK